METANHEYYVSLEVAKLLKKAGFDWDTYSAYNKDGTFTNKNRSILTWNDFANYYSAPTIEVVQRWLRETQKYQVAVLPNGLKGYATLCFLYKEPITQPFEHYSTYEEALEVGIKKVLELILEKRD